MSETSRRVWFDQLDERWTAAGSLKDKVATKKVQEVIGLLAKLGVPAMHPVADSRELTSRSAYRNVSRV
jgi:hypothetical protein